MLKKKVEYAWWWGQHVPRIGGKPTFSMARQARPDVSWEAARAWEE